MKIVKEYLNEDMGGVSCPISSLSNTPGIGNAVPPSPTTNNIGSGDNWGNSLGNYTQKKKLKKKKKKIEEESLNPYDKVGTMMAKKLNVPLNFKKGPKGTIKQKQYEHIETLDEFILNEGLDTYKKGMTISINNKEYYISKIEKDYRPKFDIVNIVNNQENKKVSSVWLDNQDVKILSKERSHIAPSKLEKISKNIGNKIDQLEEELINLENEEKEARIDMEQDLAEYDELTWKGEGELPHNIWGNKLNDLDEQKEKIIYKLKKLYSNPNCPYYNKFEKNN